MQTLILNHYPPVIKQIREMQQIAKSEDIEFEKLKSSLNGVTLNMFVLTADESGIVRFEKIFGITPQKTQTLDERRLCIIAKTQQGKISLGQLQNMLQEYSPGIKIISHMEDCELEIVIVGDAIDKNVIYKITDEILPLDIWFEILRELCAGLYVSLGITAENYVDIGWEG